MYCSFLEGNCCKCEMHHFADKCPPLNITNQGLQTTPRGNLIKTFPTFSNQKFGYDDPHHKMAPQPKGVVPCYSFFSTTISWDQWCRKSLKHQRFSNTMNHHCKVTPQQHASKLQPANLQMIVGSICFVLQM